MIVNLIEENLKNIYKKDFLNQNSIYFNNNLMLITPSMAKEY